MEIASLAPGQIITGTRYRVLSRIGEGAMGVVFAAEHVDLEKKVAIKLLLGDIARLPEAVEKFRQEARAASKIGSPYICDVTDFGELPDGQVFFVMEYLDGASVADLLKKGGPLPAPRAVALLRQAAKALGAAHEKGIIHLDVKPDNVMVLARGRRPDAVKMVDFGIAGLLYNQPMGDKISGTPEYIAPERVLGQGYTHQSDVYSMGVMAYEMLSGELPFREREILDTLKLQVTGTAIPLRHRVPTVPAELDTLVAQMMEKDPAARPANMGVVEAMLCEAQIAGKFTTDWDDLEIPAVDETWQKKLLERMPSPRGRRLRRLMFGALGLALVASAIALYFGVIRKPRVEVRFVEVTKTEEAVQVAEWLYKAQNAAKGQRYVTPPTDSALFYIEAAEVEAERLQVKSAGAGLERSIFASALVGIGNDLLKAGLRDLAVVKFKEALLFRPGDAELAKMAEISPEERKAEAARPRGAGVPARQATREADAKNAAAALFMAAEQGRMSEARLAQRQLAQLDPSGREAAGLADALRRMARAATNAGRADEGRALYQLVSDLDPRDAEAMSHARAEAPAMAVAPAPAPGATEPAAASAPKTKRRATGAEDSADIPDGPRDPVAAKTAVAAGETALGKGRLGEAEEAFNQAVRADPTNPAAHGGLAEAAFERARYTEALDFARRAVRLSPKNPKYHRIVGDAYFKSFRYAEALAAYQKGLAAAPQDAALLSRVDRVSAKLGGR